MGAWTAISLKRPAPGMTAGCVEESPLVLDLEIDVK